MFDFRCADFWRMNFNPAPALGRDGKQVQAGMLNVLSKTAHTFQRRQHLSFSGDRMEAIHRVEDGWLIRYTRLATGHRQITGIYLPGDFCEPHWIIEPVSAQWIMALSPVRTVSVALDTVMLDAEINPEKPRVVFADLIRLIDRQSDLIVALGRKSGLERLSSVVLGLYTRLIAAGADPQKSSMPLTQSDLADIVGLTPIHVNRILKELRQHRVLEIHRGSLSVLDPELLQFVSANGYFG